MLLCTLRKITIALLMIIAGCSDSKIDAPILKDTSSINYTRHEFHYPPEDVNGDLLVLVYDIPYFGACGVFPPLHVANQIFSSGGGDGGMSPGASWIPFTIDRKQYDILINQVLETPTNSLEVKSRYNVVKFIRDNTFDHIQDQFQWLEAVCKKHGERYRLESVRNQKGA